MAIGASTTLTFTWNTGGIQVGNYTVSAEAKGDDDLRDNLLTNSTVVIKLIGDCDEDGDVDMQDLSLFAPAYGATSGKPAYVPNADFDTNGIVDAKDLHKLGKNYGKS